MANLILGTTINGSMAWHSGNDGAGSGLDADLLRGLPADFTSSKAANGYQKLPSGLIIQWGNLPITSTNTAYNLPISYPTSHLMIIGQGTGSTTIGGVVNFVNSSVSTFSAASQLGIENVSWLSIGY